MLISLIFVSNISLGFLLIFIMFFSGKTNIRVNLYLILIIIQQIIHRTFLFYITFNNLDLTLLDNYPAIFTILLVPCIFLYSRTLLTKKIDLYQNHKPLLINFFYCRVPSIKKIECYEGQMFKYFKKKEVLKLNIPKIVYDVINTLN